MRSLEPLLRSLADQQDPMDPQFKQQLREELGLAARSHQSAAGLRWRTFAIVGLAAVLVFFLFKPNLMVRGNQWLFGPNSFAELQRPPQQMPLSQWMGNQNVTFDGIQGLQTIPMQQPVRKILSETHFVMRQMVLENGEVVMILSQAPPTPNPVYKYY